MKRRQLVTGFGALVGGSSILMGTGAFTSVDADRDASIEVAPEDQAYLRVFPSNGHNGEFASKSAANKLQLDFNDEIDSLVNPSGGEGVGQSSVYEFDDVFQIENQGTQTVYVNITNVSTHGGDTLVRYYVRDGSNNRRFITEGDNDVEISVGTAANIGVYINTSDKSNYTDPPGNGSGDATIIADTSSDDSSVTPS